MHMEQSSIQLDDLPDEILLTILKKLFNAEVLYSLIGVNKRFTTIASDPTFTSRITLTGSTLNGFIYSIGESQLNRLCSHVLPKIFDRIKWFNLESTAIDRIFLAANYPNLSGLGLYNLEVEQAKHLFTDEISSIHSIKNHIASFVIFITKNSKRNPAEQMLELIFTHIFTMFSNLKNLTFLIYPAVYQRLSFSNSPPAISSSILLELYATINSFNDCLYLLDGRFRQLHTLTVDISTISSSHLTISNKEDLPNLKSFSLRCSTSTDVYDELIVPLLHRMSNLENLRLCFTVHRKKTFIDGNELKTNIINHLPRLIKFTFNIHSSIQPDHQMNVPSNEDIQYTFKDFENTQIISCVDYFPDSKENHCHVYSYPYKTDEYKYITNNFPGGLFKCVRVVSLYDERPFEHEFFLRIAQSFPLMTRFKIINKKSQNEKRFKRNTNEDLLVNKYPHLIQLDLSKAHKNYLEQFLDDTKTYLPNRVHLGADYRSLKKVTRNFTRNTTRMNCSKIIYLYISNITRFPKHFKDYFLLTKSLK